jgi:hypothetical protein
MTANTRSPALLARIDATARAAFESRETFVPTLLDLGLRLYRAMNEAPYRAPRDIVRRRDGGKDPAKTLLRPVSLSSKRGRVLRYFLHSGEATVSEAMREFAMTRPAIFATWTVLNREHGIGYAFESASDAILVRLPCDEANVFQGEHVA